MILQCPACMLVVGTHPVLFYVLHLIQSLSLAQCSVVGHRIGCSPYHRGKPDHELVSEHNGKVLHDLLTLLISEGYMPGLNKLQRMWYGPSMVAICFIIN
jgi:hypothetical protein